jgi:hypothetical protein
MNRTFVLGGLLVVLCGCGGADAEKILKEQIVAINDLAQAVEGRATPETVRELRAKMEAAKKRWEDLDISAAERRKIGERYELEFIKAVGRLNDTQIRKMTIEDIRKEARKQQERTQW